MTPLDYSVIAAYFAATTAIALALAGRQTSLKDFFLGNRNVPWWLAAFRPHTHRLIPTKDADPAARNVRRKHRLQHCQGDAGFMAKRRHPAVAGIQPGVGAVLGAQRVVRSVVRPHQVAKPPVGAGASETLDPAVFVGRHRLGSQLPANPAVLLRHHDRAPRFSQSQCSGTSTYSAADHRHV